VPCADGVERAYLSLDAAASTAALPEVLARVDSFVPWYSSVHRGAGWKSQIATAAYEDARAAALRFAGREDRDDVAIICRNTTEAINHLAYRLDLRPDDVVVTTVVEHPANLLPWGRLARRRYVECRSDGTFSPDDVAATLEDGVRPPCSSSPGRPMSRMDASHRGGHRLAGRLRRGLASVEGSVSSGRRPPTCRWRVSPLKACPTPRWPLASAPNTWGPPRLLLRPPLPSPPSPAAGW
jgi:hypothetical protein